MVCLGLPLVRARAFSLRVQYALSTDHSITVELTAYVLEIVYSLTDHDLDHLDHLDHLHHLR